KKKISVFSNFIDTDIFSPRAPSEIFENRVFFIGRLNKEKNVFLLIGACKKANFGLDLIGRGELQEEFEQYAKEINADVRFLGVYANNQLPELISRYPMFALPSTWEGNPKSLLEAMSCGKAVIGTNVDGIKEIIKHKENGLLCEPNVDSIASAILYLSDKPQLRRSLGENARKYVAENANLKDITNRELQIYKLLLKTTEK
ncbi:MAG: glycosyltransferase family 4 protein, partial [Candidatus Omnitrophica bacterium]|nr:glycosyltransferase family 4 protein [Candidatus Omnitrophota bacterium]